LSCNASAAPGNSQNAERGLLVKTRKNAASDNEVAAEVANGGGRVASKLDHIGVHVVRVPAGKWAKLKDKLSKNPKYDYVEEDAQGMGLWTPNDPSYGSQWHLAKIAAPAAWDVTTGSNTVIIAVLDSGIQMNHPDLQGASCQAGTTSTTIPTLRMITATARQPPELQPQLVTTPLV
jgi:subtilisin family serine protease